MIARAAAALVCAASLLSACHAMSPAAGATREATLPSWEPADEAFRGCEGGCGERLTTAAPGVVTQPGARRGERAYCPVSGVVFEVREASSHRDIAGELVFTCCETCALYFDTHRERLIALRGF